ncbi:hypothetical protein TIFTF001_010469 [Ficus carica]|uniref:Uncharacterized protein n=1 Tax=Ficus carica TaxID=3494 RepID=A0AA87ZRS5_FICCA|nr:hypothetical protein TIFTF001_010469 [Ficus carica]
MPVLICNFKKDQKAGRALPSKFPSSSSRRSWTNAQHQHIRTLQNWQTTLHPPGKHVEAALVSAALHQLQCLLQTLLQPIQRLLHGGECHQVRRLQLIDQVQMTVM